MTVTLTKTLYTAEATATGGRAGHARSNDGLLDVDLRVPEAMGGPGGGTNPEQLFAAGYAACFQSALGVVARRQKVDTDRSTVTAEVSIGPIDGGAFGLAVTLRVAIPDLDADQARELIEAAHQVCPYSNATRGNIDVELVVA
jgi:osmotically inducible protein OsmC